jgi:hypothetical protein
VIISEDDYLAHYGIARKSGRYPWGSGGTPEQRSGSFLGMVKELRDKGMSDNEIAKGFGMNSTDFRVTTRIAKNAIKAADIARAEQLKARGLSNIAIGREMGRNESSVRALLADGVKDKTDRLQSTANMLRENVDSKGVIDVGKGVSNQLAISKDGLAAAVALLKSEGYEVHNVQLPQPGGKKTNTLVLAKPGTSYRDIVSTPGSIKSVANYSDDNGRSFSAILPPLPVSSKRVAVNYKETGGEAADGVIYVRPGVKDLSLGGASYAQVRINVDGSHYLKGMAMYKDDLPPGVDLMFNTNKSKAELGNDKLAAMKPLKKDRDGNVDEMNPFGSIVRQIGDKDERGRTSKLTSAMNLVNEEGDWDKWSKSLSSQMLSKQPPSLIKERLDETYANRRKNLDEINALTNPAVKKMLLEKEADSLDSAAVHLKAANMPRQRTQVILPINSMKPDEIYAPNFNDGENVVLVRYPHGGTFEIPELKVNNRHREARRLLGQADDAVGIHSSVAARLSGADFDGDTVLVIPNPGGRIKSKPPLKELEGFDPQARYPGYEGMPKLSPIRKQRLMGDVSNLITDMTIKGAADFEIAQAVKHSMVVIDAEKHNLNHRQSAIDNNISGLKKKYQGTPGKPGTARSGASTLISQAKSPKRIPERELRRPADGGPVDPNTGARVYVNTNRSYVDKKTGETVFRTTSVKKLDYVDDAHTLSSGTVQEKLYADHSNRLKKMANEARLASIKTPPTKWNDSAKIAYAPEIKSLNAKLNLAYENKPRERQALALAEAKIAELKRANPDMDKAEIKKLEYLALKEARDRVGAEKNRIVPTDEEWAAIQAGAISNARLTEILKNADLDKVRELATPRAAPVMSAAKKARAQRLLQSGATQAQVAEALGVSLSTLKSFIKDG